jgi:hypothetical protein
MDAHRDNNFRENVKVRISVLWEFRKDKIASMDTYWKIVER